MKSRLEQRGLHILFAIWVLAFASASLKAQYLGDQFLGLTGLKAGSLPGPGIYVTLPLFFRDSNITFEDAHGNRLLKNETAAINVFALPSVEVVYPGKIFGANVGSSYTQWLINGVIDQTGTNFHRASSYGFGDIYLQPVILGWHKQHLDITTGYAFFAPTGKGSSGQHMWVDEIDFGVTLYPDAAKNFNISTMSMYDFNQTKTTTNVKVGDILTLSGGAGRSFKHGLANAGVAYSAQWKTTHDAGADIPSFLPITNGRVFAVGPELDFPLFAKGLNLGLFSFRYLWTTGPKTQLGGHILSASFTFAHIQKPQ